MNKPIALDICCRKGGATVGLQRAGFYVIGIDVEPQPGYPGDGFYLGDGLRVLQTLAHPNNELWSKKFGWFRPDLVWQSWPCQEANTQTQGNRTRGIVDTHEQFIPRARELSDRIGIPYVLEQPTSSRKGTIRQDITLCMDMFKGDMPPPWVQKHRSFEFGNWQGMSWPEQPRHRKHDGYVRGWRGRHGDVPGFFRDGPYVACYGNGGGKAKLWEAQHAMGIDWMTDRFDLCEAVPPAYAQWIGTQFLAQQSTDQAY